MQQLFIGTDYSNYCPDTVKNKICHFILVAFNLIMEKVKSKPAQIQDIGKICNILLECELNKDIDINSIYFLYNHVTVSWFEVYRAFCNTCKIANQLLDQGLAFSINQLPPFDFSGFYASTDNFNIDNTCYIFVTESLHDISLEKRYVLAYMPWNIIIDYDPATDNGGLRQSLRRRNKSIYVEVRNIEEPIFTKEIPLWLTFDNTAYIDIFNGRKEISLGKLKIIFRKLATKLKESFSGNCTVVFLKNKEAKDNLLITELFERFADACEFHFISSTYESIKADLDILLVDDYGKPLDNYFAYSSNVYSFLAALLEYQNIFPREYSQSKDEKHSLPTIDGPKAIPENIYINLCDCFEILTGDIGLDNSNLIDNREKFIKEILPVGIYFLKAIF